MPVYDCRKTGREVGSIQFPCPVRIIDPTTNKRIADVFYLATDPAKIGRFLRGPDGEPLAKPTGSMTRKSNYNQSIEWAATTMKPKEIEPPKTMDYERLEVWEDRPWVAISIQTGAVVAKSEGVA